MSASELDHRQGGKGTRVKDGTEPCQKPLVGKEPRGAEA
jgi:hypothetical protein